MILTRGYRLPRSSICDLCVWGSSQGGKDNDRRLARHPQVQPIQGIYLQRPIARNTTIKSMVEDVKALQVKLNTTEDDDEQCALEEDITGRVMIATASPLLVWLTVYCIADPFDRLVRNPF